MPFALDVSSYVNDEGDKRPIDMFYTWAEPAPGQANGEVVVLVTGLGCQLVHAMYNIFVAPLTAKGYRVLRFDNRDSGRSTKLHDLSAKSFLAERLRCRLSDQTLKHQINYETATKDPEKNPLMKTVHNMPEDFTTSDYDSTQLQPGNRPIDFMSRDGTVSHRAQFPYHESRGFFNKVGLGKRLPCYEISDQAMDVVLLLNQLGIDRFHLHGVSMGGMIAQYVAALVPSRVSSLALIMTTTGNTNHNASMKFLLGSLVLRRPPAPDAPIAEIIAFTRETQELLGVNYPDIERSYNNHQDWDAIVSGMVRRSPRDEKAVMRQMEAIDGQECRDHILDFLAARLPIFIWHGRQDQLVPYSNAAHMYGICVESLKRQINPPKVRHPDDTSPQPEPHPLDVVSTVDGRRHVTTTIGKVYNGRRPFTTLCEVDKAAHDITDDVVQYHTAQYLAHLDAAMGRVNIQQPLVLPEVQWGTEPDICFGAIPTEQDDKARAKRIPIDQLEISTPNPDLLSPGADFVEISPQPTEVAEPVNAVQVPPQDEKIVEVTVNKEEEEGQEQEQEQQ